MKSKLALGATLLVITTTLPLIVTLDYFVKKRKRTWMSLFGEALMFLGLTVQINFSNAR